MHCNSYIPSQQPCLRNTYFTVALLLAVIFCVGNPAFAAPPIFTGDDTLCDTAAIAYGNLGRGLATIAIIALGVAAMLGKVTWGIAALVGTGIAAVFNAGNILALIEAKDPTLSC